MFCEENSVLLSGESDIDCAAQVGVNLIFIKNDANIKIELSIELEFEILGRD